MLQGIEDVHQEPDKKSCPHYRAVLRYDGSYPSFSWSRKARLTELQAANMILGCGEDVKKFGNKMFMVLRPGSEGYSEAFRGWFEARMACSPADRYPEPPVGSLALYNYDGQLWLIEKIRAEEV